MVRLRRVLVDRQENTEEFTGIQDLCHRAATSITFGVCLQAQRPARRMPAGSLHDFSYTPNDHTDKPHRATRLVDRSSGLPTSPGVGPPTHFPIVRG
jgi:hypothetical protein